jgi:hypothetical protein
VRVEPTDVYLRLEPGAHVINYKTGDVRTTPCVELHWKDGSKWVRRSFVATDEAPTLGAILRVLGEWADGFADLDAMLEAAGGKTSTTTTATKPSLPEDPDPTSPAPAEPPETAWLVEREAHDGTPPQWAYIRHSDAFGIVEWATNAGEAKRFATREEAETFITANLLRARATSHSWSLGAAPAEPPERPETP